MLFTEIEIKDKSYKLRLTTKYIVQLEKKIGCNPLFIFGTDGKRVPEVGEMVAILWASLQEYNHNLTMDDCYDLFDSYLEEHTINDFIVLILEIYKTGGLVKDNQEATEKN